MRPFELDEAPPSKSVDRLRGGRRRPDRRPRVPHEASEKNDDIWPASRPDSRPYRPDEVERPERGRSGEVSQEIWPARQPVGKGRDAEKDRRRRKR